MALNLTAEKAFIFRITHRDNIPWIVQHGLHCRNSGVVDPNFVAIGNPGLIDKRRTQIVPCPPGGPLSDYVPFYFTPHSIMALQIKTGHNGIRRRENDEIAIIVSSLYKLRDDGVPFLFTDRHASLRAAAYHSDLSALDTLDWDIWRRRDFAGDPEYLDKKDHYQAEALVHKRLPIKSILGLVCHSEDVTSAMRQRLGEAAESIKIATKPSWYF